MALFHKAKAHADSPNINEVLSLVEMIKKRVRNLEHTERDVKEDIEERGERLQANLDIDLENAGLIKSEIDSMKDDTKRKSGLIDKSIAELKRCVVESEFNEVKEKMEKWDPADMITEKEFDNEIKRELNG